MIEEKDCMSIKAITLLKATFFSGWEQFESRPDRVMLWLAKEKMLLSHLCDGIKRNKPPPPYWRCDNAFSPKVRLAGELDKLASRSLPPMKYKEASMY